MRPLHDHSERAFVAQITNLLGRPLDAVVGAAPVLKEASHGCPALEDAHFPRRCVPDSVGSVEAQGCLEVLGLDAPACKLDQAGGRGLLRHQLSIADRCFRRASNARAIGSVLPVVLCASSSSSAAATT